MHHTWKRFWNLKIFNKIFNFDLFIYAICAGPVVWKNTTESSLLELKFWMYSSSARLEDIIYKKLEHTLNMSLFNSQSAMNSVLHTKHIWCTVFMACRKEHETLQDKINSVLICFKIFFLLFELNGMVVLSANWVFCLHFRYISVQVKSKGKSVHRIIPSTFHKAVSWWNEWDLCCSDLSVVPCFDTIIGSMLSFITL